ncbi:fatty-acid-binding protein 1 isoform X2 [Andrographis paniculata]|uniref:fatty-acid-binding protein 1 isoform X2 n=1 Tax=Andrographis paniculata TaxID=175694 RepID=UPI0021E7C31F|nr:fatty-acid-binding protein 1 isoform X2 [Andrographis paniculata]
MVSFRFPFSFSQPSQPPNVTPRRFPATAVAASVAVAATAGAGVAISLNSDFQFLPTALNLLTSSRNGFCSLSLADNSSSPVTESRTGMSFPAVIKDSQRLLGVGVRRKAILGLKNIDVYAFGVYADDDGVKKHLGEKYREFSPSELKVKEELRDDLMESDVKMTVRLQIVYGRLSIRSVRSAFEESVGSRLRNFEGSDNKELLQRLIESMNRFTSQFRDEYKIPRGSIIDLSREEGYVLRTSIDGKEVGSIESKVLCRSILDLYIGSHPFDQKAQQDVALNLAHQTLLPNN